MCRDAAAAVMIIACLLAATGCAREKPISPQRATQHYVKSRLLAEKGELEAALRELSRAVQADPTLSVAHAAMGNIYRKQGRYDLARRSYEQACETNPYAFRPHYNLGVTCQALAAAAESIEQARSYLRKAVETYLRAATLIDDDFDTNLNLSACYFELGNATLAEQYCQAAIRIDPKRPEAHTNLGVIRETQERLYEAITAYKNALELTDDRYTVLMSLGGAYVRQDRLAAAMLVYADAIREQPARPEPLVQTGLCNVLRRKFAEAMEAYKRAAEVDPGHAPAYRGIGVVYMSLYLHDPTQTDFRDNGLEAWNRSLELQPQQKDLIRLVRKYTPKPHVPEL